MSKFLLLSGGGDGLGLALRLKQEGHNVGVWIREGRYKMNYNGLLQKVLKWEDFLDKNTIVIFDSNGGGKTAERLKSRGTPVFAGSLFADELELDRATALALMEEVGIKVPHSETFTDWNSAREYLRTYDGKIAFKASGELGATVPSYVSHDAEDMLEMLDHFEKIGGKSNIEFELQEFIKGTAISTEGWFNGKEFMLPFNHTLERKQIMNDDLGPSGGCAGNIVWRLDGSNQILENGIKKFAGPLADQNYIGPCDLNTIVNDKGVWALEFTPRFGYDALPALLELLDEPVGTLIESMAREEHPKEIHLKEGFSGGVRISIPPYPSEHFRAEEGLPVRGFTRQDRNHLYFYDVHFNEENKLVTTAAGGAIVCCTGYGKSREESMHYAYKLVEKARIPNLQYRTDLTTRFSDDYRSLNEQGFLDDTSNRGEGKDNGQTVGVSKISDGQDSAVRDVHTPDSSDSVVGV